MKPVMVAIAFVGTAVASAAAATFILNEFYWSDKTEAWDQQENAYTEELARAMAQLNRAEEELAKAEARIREMESASTATPAAKPEPEDMTAASAEPLEEAKTDDAGDDLTLEGVRDALRNNPGASAQLKALTEMYYAGVLNNLQLDNETKAALRELLTDSQIEETALMQHAMQSGDSTWKDVAAWRNAERARLDEQVRALLSADDYAQWSAHFAAIDEHTLDAVLRNQIRTVASGLTTESFDAVMQVAVEEFRHEQQTLEQSDVPFNIEENVNYQLRAMDAMRVRLEGFLSQEQYAELENWLTMGENMLRASLPQN